MDTSQIINLDDYYGFAIYKAKKVFNTGLQYADDKTMLKRGSGNIKRWIEFIKRSKHKLSGLRTFANGLLRDIEAVNNAIHMPWSNGAVEGHVNRIKNIKRQMYGRASFDLLRKKVILSQSG